MIARRFSCPKFPPGHRRLQQPLVEVLDSLLLHGRQLLGLIVLTTGLLQPLVEGGVLLLEHLHQLTQIRLLLRLLSLSI